jgi:hypothetical protein
LGYSLVAFKARDDQKRPIYHTNVLMAIGTSVAVCNFDAIYDPDEAKMVRESLEKVTILVKQKLVDMTRVNLR